MTIDLDSHVSAPWLAEVQCRYLVHADLPALEWNGEYTHFRRLYQDAFESAQHGHALLWVVEVQGAGLIGQAFVQLSSSRRELADGVTKAYVNRWMCSSMLEARASRSGNLKAESVWWQVPSR